MIRPTLPLLASAAVLLLLAAGGASAQYKIVGPDGRVTYTDRPPADPSLRVQNLRSGATAGAAPAAQPSVPLPPDLQRLRERFPVVLFSGNDCAPCDAGRQLLRARGVPFDERTVSTGEDVAALERTIGTRTLPALTVGGQALTGYQAQDWTSYLDAAGYPRESRLPRNWQPSPAQPLVARVAPRPTPTPTPVAERGAEPTPPAAAEPIPTTPGGIRF